MSNPRRSRRPRSFDRPRFLWVVTIAVMLFLFTPILVVVAFSFNGADSLARIDGFSLRWYEQALTDPAIRASFWQSVVIAIVSSLVATVCGSAIAIGLRRVGRFLRGYGSSIITVRLVSPETATAVALFLAFGLLGIRLSFMTVLISHIALSLAFVVVIVQSQLSLLGREIEDAAMDLGSTPGRAVWRVVVPQLIPALLASGLLAFIISFDNFATTFYTAGMGTTPLPLWIYSSMRFGLSPVVNAIGVLLLLLTLAVLAVLAGTVGGRLTKRRK